MGSDTLVKEDAAMEEAANAQVKQVREALVELLLPSEVIDLALQKIEDFEGNIDRIANYAMSLPMPESSQVPQVECIEEHLSDDMVSSDEDASCVQPDGRWMQLPSNLPSLAVEAVKGEVWEDPICKLFQEPHGPEDEIVALHESGSSKAIVVAVKAEAGCSNHVAPVDTEKEASAPSASPPPSAAPIALALPLSTAQRQTIFLEMGFAFDLVDRAFKQHGPEVEDSVLLQFIIDNENNNRRLARHVNEEVSDDEAELRARVLQNIPNAAVRSSKAPARLCTGKSDSSDSDTESEFHDSFYMSNKCDGEASTSRNRDSNTLEKLITEFQFPSTAVEKAMERCRTPLRNATEEDIATVVDFLAAHMEDLIEDATLPDSDDSEEESDDFSLWNWLDEATEKNSSGKRPYETPLAARGKRNVHRGPLKGRSNFAKNHSEKSPVHHKRMGATGFGLPGMPVQQRELKEDVRGAPYFYFENVASMPVGEWERIQTHLFDIEPEFVDAMHFSACRRSRGYIHNLPLKGRKKIIKDPPMTIKELMPQTIAYWPEWDKRSKLNCINTVRGSEYCAKQQRIRDGTPITEQNLTDKEKKERVDLCSKWNLVWTSPNLATPIEANEIEVMLGFDKDHSRPILGSTAKYRALGNSFSVYTVAFHFSVLRPLYPKGIKVLSLFSGIGGAEVALHKVGLYLHTVVSVEIEEEPRRCLQTWWAHTNQTGTLDIQYHDVRELTRDVLTRLVNKYRGFDLIVGGSPCNNLTGNNRQTRTGLEGEHSTMFFEFSRIVSTVRELTINLHGKGKL